MRAIVSMMTGAFRRAWSLARSAGGACGCAFGWVYARLCAFGSAACGFGSRVRANWRSEVADAVTVFLLTASGALLLSVGATVDMAKNATVRGDLNDIAQEAVQAAVRVQDGKGNLKGTKCQNGQKVVLNGITAANTWLSSSNATNDPAIALVAKSYLEKTGRGSYISSSSVYNGTDSMGNSGTYTAQNDANFVTRMRQYGYAGSNSGELDDDELKLTIWCSSGLTSENGSSDVSTGSDKTNVINLEVNDWSSNFMIGMFSNAWAEFDYQTYTITQHAITSWSKSAVS